jgi:hypothetical protein
VGPWIYGSAAITYLFVGTATPHRTTRSSIPFPIGPQRASRHLGIKHPRHSLLLAMLVIFPSLSGPSFHSENPQLTLYLSSSTRATPNPLCFHSRISQTNIKQTPHIPVYHYQQSPFSIGLVITTQFFWPLVLSILLSGYPALLLASRFCLLWIALVHRLTNIRTYIYTYTHKPRTNHLYHMYFLHKQISRVKSYS